jgi:VanZ family protein
MSDNKLKKIMPILCILWICLIFFMSSDAKSYDKTLSFSEGVSSQIHGTEAGIEIDGNKDGNTEVDIINLSIRKSGHFLEYLVLSVLLLKTSEVYGKQGKKTIGYVLLLCLLIAGLDEFYQSFIPGRNPAVLDSLIDFAGACMGMVIYVGIGRLIGRSRSVE